MTTNVSSRNGIPIACNPGVFSRAELDAHVSRALDVIFKLPTRTEELPDGYLLEYVGNESLLLELARFVHDEHRCCPWESFSIEMEPFPAGTTGTIRLRYIGGVEGKPILTEAFERFRAAAFDEGTRERLLAALQGAKPITSESKDRLYELMSEADSSRSRPSPRD